MPLEGDDDGAAATGERADGERAGGDGGGGGGGAWLEALFAAGKRRCKVSLFFTATLLSWLFHLLFTKIKKISKSL